MRGITECKLHSGFGGAPTGADLQSLPLVPPAGADLQSMPLIKQTRQQEMNNKNNQDARIAKMTFTAGVGWL